MPSYRRSQPLVTGLRPSYHPAVPRVVALYRYPVKGFTPEACETLTVLEEGRIAGDRVLGFRFADSGAPDSGWSRKEEGVVLLNTPGLARLAVRFDHAALRLRFTRDGTVLAEESLDDNGRKRLCAALEGYVLGLAENPLSGHPARLPLRLVGDGVTPRYQDNVEGQATLHSRESLAAVAAAIGDPAARRNPLPLQYRHRRRQSVGGARLVRAQDSHRPGRVRRGQAQDAVPRHARQSAHRRARHCDDAALDESFLAEVADFRGRHGRARGWQADPCR